MRTHSIAHTHSVDLEDFNLRTDIHRGQPVDHPKRIALRAATQRILSLATKRTNRKSASKSKWGQRQSSSSPIKSPIKSPKSPTLNSTASRQSRAYVHSTSPRPQKSPSRKRDAGPQLGLEVLPHCAVSFLALSHSLLPHSLCCPIHCAASRVDGLVAGWLQLSQNDTQVSL